MIIQMLPCNVKHIPPFPLLFSLLEMRTDIINIFVPNNPTELVIIFIPKLSLLAQQFRNEIIFFPQTLSQSAYLALQFFVSTYKFFPFIFLPFNRAEYFRSLVLLLIAIVILFISFVNVRFEKGVGNVKLRFMQFGMGLILYPLYLTQHILAQDYLYGLCYLDWNNDRRTYLYFAFLLHSFFQRTLYCFLLLFYRYPLISHNPDELDNILSNPLIFFINIFQCLIF